MSVLMFICLFAAVMVFSLALHWIDAKKGWKLNAWMMGDTHSPFPSEVVQRDSAEETTEVSQLKERVAVLEQIVTEPVYELNKKLNSLK
ncbi:MAG: hypothetical protein GJ680_00480 [Alteromonadaceae bacterium]|nr:hypothetical protein [Alteromonadaceae bacterium]